MQRGEETRHASNVNEKMFQILIALFFTQPKKIKTIRRNNA